MTKQTRLDQIATDIKNKNICPDLAQTATQLVMGDGNLDADIVFVGEAPGRKEDETGKGFVGASGKVLDELLESIGLDRADIYITNIVKYRPPDNRDPKLAEKQAFLPYLTEQLSVIGPKLVVTLGKHSLEALSPKSALSEVHGTILNTGEDWQLMPAYHPAAAIYNQKLKPTLLDDFAKLALHIN